MEAHSLAEAWGQALESDSIKILGPATVNYLRSAKPLGDIEGTILLCVSNDFTKSWIGAAASPAGRTQRLPGYESYRL